MELHEELSLSIAASDLQYVAGSILGAGSHPRIWATAQWGVMTTYEADQTLRRVHGAEPTLSWEQSIAEAARHGGKFFDGKRNLDQVLDGFRGLIEANRDVFYPPARARLFDWLRDDLSVITVGDEIVLTSLSGQFMLGFPPDRVVDFSEWGPHVTELLAGVGEAAAWSLPGEALASLGSHGNHDATPARWWDGQLGRLLPSAFGGELSAELSLSLITIHSTVQAARKWARADCCPWCMSAALKHRFVVLHHAARSLEQLGNRPQMLGLRSAELLSELLTDPDVRTVVTPPYRRLRNGWFHLGITDIADQLPAQPDVLSPVVVYTGQDPLALLALVDRALDTLADGLGRWIQTPDRDGKTIFDHLRRARGETALAARTERHSR